MANLVRTTRNGRPSLFDTSFGGDPFAFAEQLLGWSPTARSRSEDRAFVPTFDVVENGDSYLLTADLPGVREEDLEITLHQNRLTVSGKRDAEERKEGESYYLYERRHGSFSRSFSLPEDADAESVDAKLEDGVLRLRIGKSAEAQPRKIQLGK